MHTLTSQAPADAAPARPTFDTAPWIAVAGLAAALALVAWAGTEQDTATTLECRISHPVGGSAATTVMLINAAPQTLPAGTEWAWAPAGGDPQLGERLVLAQPLAGGAAVRVQSVVPAVALRCRAALVAPSVQPGSADAVASLPTANGLLSPR